MRKFIILACVLFFAATLKAQNDSSVPLPSQRVEDAILRIVNEYPQATLQDIYKSFYQAHFGPQHFITDTASVRRYLHEEIQIAGTDTVPAPYEEPVGANNQYVRIHLRSVIEGKMAEEELLRAFLQSNNTSQSTIPWAEEWQTIVSIVDRLKVSVPADEALRSALSECASKDQAVRHSEQYRQAYHPHYRVVKKDIR